MIDLKELRIGNYVAAPLGEIMKVEILGHPEQPNYIFARYVDGFGQNAFEPIPLTAEILIKCGFRENTFGQGHEFEFAPTEWLVINDLGAHLSGDEEAFFTIQCKYVHQLQNLYLALTGKELIIDFLKEK